MMAHYYKRANDPYCLFFQNIRWCFIICWSVLLYMISLHILYSRHFFSNSFPCWYFGFVYAPEYNLGPLGFGLHVPLSVFDCVYNHLSFSLWRICNLWHNICTIIERDLILGMHTLLLKPVQGRLPFWTLLWPFFSKIANLNCCFWWK